MRNKLLTYLAEKLRSQNQLLEVYVASLSKKKPRSTIVLFGSRAVEKQLPYSDFDVAVIVEELGDALAEVEELRKLKPKGMSLDLLVISKKELQDPLIREMLRNAKILYDGLGIAEKFRSKKQPQATALQSV